MAHDFERFPELANAQMDLYYFESPHKQIAEDFRAEVAKVIDGDTIRLKWKERDFDFPLRMLDIDAPEVNQPNGKEVQSWLESQILNSDVDIKINPNRRVGKFGRLLGKVIHRGMDMGEVMLGLGMVTTFENRDEGKMPTTIKILNEGRIK